MNRQKRRKRRLLSLVEEAGSQRELAERVGSSPNTISQLVSGHRPVGNDLAERFEVAMGKPNGWMDQWLPDEGGWAANQRHPDWYLFDRYQEIQDEDMRRHIRGQILAASRSGRKATRQKASK